jgi:hypothetical protein
MSIRNYRIPVKQTSFVNTQRLKIIVGKIANLKLADKDKSLGVLIEALDNFIATLDKINLQEDIKKSPELKRPLTDFYQSIISISKAVPVLEELQKALLKLQGVEQALERISK